MHVDSKDSTLTDGLDIRALIFTLWRQRLIVVCVCLFVTLVAGAYVLVAEPVYEAKAFVMPPRQNDIEGLNYGRTVSNHLAPLTVKDVYNVFLNNLQAESLRREFFKKTYLPALGRDDDPKGLLYEKLSKSLLISLVGKDTADRYSVVVQFGNSELAAKWVEQYIARAGELAVQEINKNISTEAEVQARNLHQEILSAREVGEKSREDALTKLREALAVAKAIGLEKPAIINSNPSASLGIVGSMSGELVYMRGTKALEAEIDNLQNRKSDDPFLERLRNLEAQYNFYKQLENASPVATVYREDGVVEVSGSPVKPKVAFVLSIGFIFGLMLGVVAALIRDLVLNKKINVNER